MKKYVTIEATRDENAICLETGYDEGGYNWFSGATNRRGYYLYCTPVQITPHKLDNGTEYNSISQALGKGNKLLLKEVTRRSKKAEAEAELIAEKKADWLLGQVMERYGLKFTGKDELSRSEEKQSLDSQIGAADSLKKLDNEVANKTHEPVR